MRNLKFYNDKKWRVSRDQNPKWISKSKCFLSCLKSTTLRQETNAISSRRIPKQKFFIWLCSQSTDRSEIFTRPYNYILKLVPTYSYRECQMSWTFHFWNMIGIRCQNHHKNRRKHHNNDLDQRLQDNQKWYFFACHAHANIPYGPNVIIAYIDTPLNPWFWSYPIDSLIRNRVSCSPSKIYYTTKIYIIQ